MEQAVEEKAEQGETKDQGNAPAEGRRRGGENSNGHVQGSVVLGPRDRLEGKLIIESNLVVQGSVEGEVVTSGDVTIEASATVKARLECRNLSVRGNVEGDVQASRRLLVAGSGVLNGNVRVQKLQVEDGATLNGSISMGGGQ